MRCSPKWSVAYLLVFGAGQISASFDFYIYPICAQPILDSTAPSRCDYGQETTGEVVEEVACLCSDASWLNNAASQIGGSCGCTDLIDSAKTLSSGCDAGGTPSALTADEFIAAGNCSPENGGGANDSTTNPENTAPADTTTAGKSGDSSDSPTSDRIALGVGIGIGVPTAILTAFGVWLQCIRKQ